VLKALGLPAAQLGGALRFSLGRSTDENAIDQLLAALPQIVARVRG
jgi:cysteine sulfinate desulfinase/cysteine desulfurase-like protein